MASFLNVPSFWFTQRWFGVPSLAISRSGQPSPVKSAAYTPSPGAAFVASPAGTVTSANRTGLPSPGPRLRNSRGMVPGNDLGPQKSRLPSGLVARPGRVVVEVVDDDQVEPAVPVVVDERGRGAPVRVDDAGRGSVMSRNLPPPSFRSSLAPVYWVISTSGRPSLSTSPIATPMLYPSKSSPLPADASRNLPSGVCR